MDRKTIIFFLLIICSMTISCQIVEQAVNPVKKESKSITKKSYNKDRLSFSYPDNWKITEDTLLEDKSRIVVLEDSYSGAFAVSLPESGYALELKEYADNYITGLKAEMPIGKTSDIQTFDIEKEIKGEKYNGIRKRFDVIFLGVNVPHTTDFYLVSKEDTGAIIMLQAADEDWKASEKEFQIMIDSLDFE
jgi:hypothetical protein